MVVGEECWYGIGMEDRTGSWNAGDGIDLK